MRPQRRILALSLAAVLYACANPSAGTPSPNPSPTSVATTGIHKIQHVVVIMQENRSFDQYFGTFPGADGLPTQNGQ
ncbi:MAG TPA: alkaline phosphatase family protein, partial [Candidatus Dormibacteraeota bacterium]